MVPLECDSRLGIASSMMAETPDKEAPPPVRPNPDETPKPGPKGPRTPYPVDDPGITDLPGQEPDYIPGTPLRPGRL
jgi:hypothetical protein